MLFEGVIFDVDGVLVDSPHEHAWRETLEELMNGPWRGIRAHARYSPDLFDTRVYLEFVAGKPREAGARSVLAHFGVPEPERLAKIYADEKQAKVASLIQEGDFQAFPDALRFVLALLERKIPMAVASSSRNANDLLARIVVAEPLDEPDKEEPGATLLDVFDANVCGREFPYGKPHPDIFLGAAAELGVSPEASLVVEDATAGILAAKAGKFWALGVARLGDQALLRAAGADLVVTSLDEVDLDALAQGHLAARRAAA